MEITDIYKVKKGFGKAFGVEEGSELLLTYEEAKNRLNQYIKDNEECKVEKKGIIPDAYLTSLCTPFLINLAPTYHFVSPAQ